jgi:hypothetical protein
MPIDVTKQFFLNFAHLIWEYLNDIDLWLSSCKIFPVSRCINIVHELLSYIIKYYCNLRYPVHFQIVPLDLCSFLHAVKYERVTIRFGFEEMSPLFLFLTNK